jgi:hypothetical protein
MIYASQRVIVIWAPFETDIHELEYGKDFGLTEMSMELRCEAAHPLRSLCEHSS